MFHNRDAPPSPSRVVRTAITFLKCKSILEDNGRAIQTPKPISTDSSPAMHGDSLDGRKATKPVVTVMRR